MFLNLLLIIFYFFSKHGVVLLSGIPLKCYITSVLNNHWFSYISSVLFVLYNMKCWLQIIKQTMTWYKLSELVLMQVVCVCVLHRFIILIYNPT